MTHKRLTLSGAGVLAYRVIIMKYTEAQEMSNRAPNIKHSGKFPTWNVQG